MPLYCNCVGFLNHLAVHVIECYGEKTILKFSSSCPSFFLVIIYRVDGEGGKCYCPLNVNNAPVI